MFEYKAIISRVIDGDTVEAKVDLGFDVHKVEVFRLARIDAYETRLGKNTTAEQKKIGIEAKNYVKDLIDGKEVIIKTEREGKYGRYIAEIIFDGMNLSDDLVIKKYAIYKEY